MHILIVNTSSFKMTLSNNLCKHFYIRSKRKKKNEVKKNLRHLFQITYSPPSLNMYNGVNSFYRHAGVLVYMLYVAVHIQGINMTAVVQ